MTTTVPFGSLLPKSTTFASEPGRKPWGFVQDGTPVALTSAPLALREAVTCFAEILNPLMNADMLRFVGGEFVPNVASHGVTIVRRAAQIDEADLDLSEAPTPGEALRAIEALVVELGITHKEFFQASNIKKRTYHSWAGPDAPRPRAQSLGRLWELAETVLDLRVILGRSVQQWIHSAPERKAMLLAGRFDAVVEAALVSTSSVPSRLYDRYAVGSEVAVPVIREPEVATRKVERGLRL